MITKKWIMNETFKITNWCLFNVLLQSIRCGGKESWTANIFCKVFIWQNYRQRSFRESEGANSTLLGGKFPCLLLLLQLLTFAVLRLFWKTTDWTKARPSTHSLAQALTTSSRWRPRPRRTSSLCQHSSKGRSKQLMHKE